MTLIAWYPLNDNFNDYSGNKNNLVQNGGGTLSLNTSGKLGSCYETTSKNQTTHLISSKELINMKNDISMFCWVNIKELATTDSANGVVTCHNHSTEKGMGITVAAVNAETYRISCNTGYVEGGRTYNTFRSQTNLKINTWNHIGFTYSAKEKKINFYANGKFDGSASIPSNKTQSNLNYKIALFAWSLGYLGNGTYSPNQKLNDVRVYNHILSAKEVREIYKTNFVHYNFNNPNEEPTKNLFTSIGFNTAEKGSDYFVKKETDQWYQGAVLGKVNVTAGSTYIWSLEIKSDMTFPIKFDANCTATNYTGNDAAIESNSSYPANYSNPGSWQKIYLKCKVKSDAESPYLHHTFCPAAITGKNIKVYVRNHQVECKENVTPYINGTRNGILSDSSGYGNNVSIPLNSSCPSWIDDTNLGSYSAYFNGVNNFIALQNNLPIHNDFSLNIWFKYKKLNNYSRIIELSSAASGVNRFLITNVGTTNELGIRVGLESDTIASISLPNAVKLNEWHMITVTKSNLTLKAYMDGVLKQTVTMTGQLKNISRSISNLGKSSYPNDGYFNGNISDFKFYTNVLSDSDVKELFESKGSVSKNGTVFANQLIQRKNYADDMNKSINELKTTNGISFYTQAHCQVTLTSDGIRIYRTPNLVHSTAGNVMWGGLRLQFPEGTFKKGRKYRFYFKAKGQTSNTITTKELTPQMGWTAGGLTALKAVDKESKVIPANFKSNTYQEFYLTFDTSNFNIYQQATKTESMFTEGNLYNCTRDLGLGFGYSDTGTLGTDLYIKDLKLFDITENEKISIDKKSNIILNDIHEINYKPTLVDYSTWKLGTGSISNWSCNGAVNENVRLVKTNPFKCLDIVWASESNDSTNTDGDGGFNCYNIAIDHTKKYRFTCWMRRENVGDGTIYFGCQGNTVTPLGSTTANSNPYFFNANSSGSPEFTDNWCLFVGYIHPSTYSGSSDTTNGIYRVDTKAKVRSVTDFKWVSDATVGGIRSYLFYSSSTSERVYWYRPRFEICDGTEPSIKTLLSGSEHTPLCSENGIPLIGDKASFGCNGTLYNKEFIEI